jgi:hypothetical protein
MAEKFECDCCNGAPLPRKKALRRPRHAGEVERHLETFAGGYDQVNCVGAADGVHTHVYISGPTEARPFCVLLTAGLSDSPMHPPPDFDLGPCRAELSICLPPDWRFTSKAGRRQRWWWPIRELCTWAAYPRRQGAWIWYHHTVGGLEPLAPNLPFSSMLLHPSRELPEEFWKIPTATGEEIWVLSLYPIHDAELRLAHERGAHALIDRLEAAGVTDLFDPSRRSVCR